VGISRWKRDGGREEGSTARHTHHPRGQEKEESSSRSGGERQIYLKPMYLRMLTMDSDAD